MPNPIREILLKLRFKLLGSTLENYKEIATWQWLDRKQTHALQTERLEKLMLHAFQNVPYYRSILGEAGVIDPSGSVNLDRFSRIPLLDKDTIRHHFENLKSIDYDTRNWFENSSGGSTGQPVKVIQDAEYNSWTEAIKILYDGWTGRSISSPRVILWGSVRDLFNEPETLKIRLIRWLNNDIWLNAFRMSPEEMLEYAKKISSFKPSQILSYADSIYELACFIKNANLVVYPPKAIMTSAGTLFQEMRETIGEVFRSPVFNRYGSREVGDIACECDRHEGLHVCVPTHYVEILAPDGTPAEPGEAGEVIVTSLVNYVMPLIRYRIGDMAIWAERQCRCGRNWPLLKHVVGRVTDVFRKPEGGIISPEFFIHLIGVEMNKGWIHRFQVVQEEYNRLRIYIVDSGKQRSPLSFYHNHLVEISAKIRCVMGLDCDVTYEFVKDIQPEPSGKYRYTISKLS